MTAARTLRLTAHPPEEPHGLLLALNRRTGHHLNRPVRSLSGIAKAHLDDLGVQVASPVLAHRLLTQAVRLELDVHAPSATARTFGAAVRELLRVQADLSTLVAHASPRVRDVARVTNAYRDLLRAHHAVDGAEVLAVAAQTIEPQGLLTLYGYVRLTLDELRFLNVIAGQGSVAFLPHAPHPLFSENEAAAAWLHAHGWTVERDDRPPTGASAAFLGLAGDASVHARVCADAEAEVRAALADVKRLLTSGVPARDIALVVADDAAWGPLVSAVAWEYGTPVDVTASVPLAQTRVGSWVQRALDVAEHGATFERVTRLLGHPLDAGLSGQDWQAVRHARPEGMNAWTPLDARLHTLSWPEADTRAAWSARLTAELDARGVTGRVREGHPVEGAALQVLQAELLALAVPAEERLSREDFLEEVRGALALLTVAPQPGGEAVELLTPYALIGAAVPHVIVLGLAEGAWPAPLQDDPILDFAARKALRAQGVPLEVPGSLARREMLSFWSLLRAAGGTLTLSYARIGLSGEANLPSAHLTRLGVNASPAEATLACSPEEARPALITRGDDDETITHARHALRVERHREASPHYDEHDGLTGVPVDVTNLVFSAAQLQSLGTCPFRWWLQSLLRLEVDEDEDETVGLGKLQHAALHRAAQAALDRPESDPREVMLSVLNESLTQAEAELSWPRTPQWPAERLEVRARLERLIRSADFLREGARLEAVEQTFEGTWQGLRVRGQVDRVDRVGDKLIVVDYKSGSSKPWGTQDADGKLGLDVQLPVYLQAALPALYPGEKAGGAHYLSIRGAEVTGRVTLNETAFEQFAGKVRSVLTRGAFVPQPDVQGKACTRCPFPPVCRAGPRLARKERA